MSEAPAKAGRHPFVVVLAVIVFAECAMLAVATGYLVIEILVARPASLPSAIALTVLVAIGAVWLAFIATNLLRGRAWTRGATVVTQVLQIAVAIGCFQGVFARPDIGWMLLIPALAALALLFSPPVIRATTVRDDA